MSESFAAHQTDALLIPESVQSWCEQIATEPALASEASINEALATPDLLLYPLRIIRAYGSKEGLGLEALDGVHLHKFKVIEQQLGTHGVQGVQLALEDGRTIPLTDVLSVDREIPPLPDTYTEHLHQVGKQIDELLARPSFMTYPPEQRAEIIQYAMDDVEPDIRDALMHGTAQIKVATRDEPLNAIALRLFVPEPSPHQQPTSPPQLCVEVVSEEGAEQLPYHSVEMIRFIDTQLEPQLNVLELFKKDSHPANALLSADYLLADEWESLLVQYKEDRTNSKANNTLEAELDADGDTDELRRQMRPIIASIYHQLMDESSGIPNDILLDGTFRMRGMVFRREEHGEFVTALGTFETLAAPKMSIAYIEGQWRTGIQLTPLDGVATTNDDLFVIPTDHFLTEFQRTALYDDNQPAQAADGHFDDAE